MDQLPLQSQSVKYPINLQGKNHRQIKLMSIYLELKRKAKSGVLTKADIRSVHYYKAKLLDLGIVKLDRSGRHYLLRRNAAVWRIFGISKTISKNKKYKRVFCKKIEQETTRKEIQEILFQQQANTLKQQMKFVRNAGRRRKNLTMEAPLSSYNVAKLFGYKQACTGGRKRRKYFKLINEPLQKIKMYLPEINPYGLITRYKTRTIML